MSGFPYEARHESGMTIIRFYPKGKNAKNPDSIVFVLALNKNDADKLKKIIS